MAELTVRQLAQISENPDPKYYDLAGDLKALVPEMVKAGVTSKRRVAAFLATIIQETDRLKTLEEYGGYSYWLYLDRMSGRAGEWRYHGRGYIMLTWRLNYERAGRAIGADLVAKPDLLKSHKPTAAKAALWFWKANGVNPYADRGEFYNVSAIVNTGSPNGTPNHYSDRKYFYDRAMRALPDGFKLTAEAKEDDVPEEKPLWLRNWEKARAYQRKCIEATPNILYWFWDDGFLNYRRDAARRPASVDGPPPAVGWIRRYFCADHVTLGMRAAGLAIPKNRGDGWNYDGGTQAFWLAYQDVMVPFRASEMRDGDAAYRRFRDTRDEGHIMVEDGGKASQSFASDNLGNPGPNRIYTVEESHDGGYYQYRIPREELWTPRSRR